MQKTYIFSFTTMMQRNQRAHTVHDQGPGRTTVKNKH